jgi:hypothetical protein
MDTHFDLGLGQAGTTLVTPHHGGKGIADS